MLQEHRAGREARRRQLLFQHQADIGGHEIAVHRTGQIRLGCLLGSHATRQGDLLHAGEEHPELDRSKQHNQQNG
jgi:hypothetical protein